MSIPAKVIVGSQDDDSQCKCRNLFRSVVGPITVEKLRTYQREANYYIIMTEAACDLDTRIVSESHDKENEDYEDDIDNGKCRSSSDCIHEVWLWPGRDDFFGWMHSEQLTGCKEPTMIRAALNQERTLLKVSSIAGSLEASSCHSSMYSVRSTTEMACTLKSEPRRAKP